MNAGAAWFLALAGASAFGNWWSVATGRRESERITKPLTMVLLTAMALMLNPLSPAIRAWFVLGLLLSLAGDVFLMLEHDKFIAGLAAFLGAHLAYIAGFLLAPVEVAAALAGLGVAAIGIGTIGRRIHRAASRSDRRLGVPVAVYVGVISTMVVAAAATTSLVALAGAALFYVSDAILGWNRFVSPLENGRMFTMITYHSGQALLVTALITL